MKKTKRPPAKTDADRPLHLRVDPAFRSKLDTIVGWMQTDPALCDLKIRPGLEKAIRYAVVRLIASPPEHVGAERG